MAKKKQQYHNGDRVRLDDGELYEWRDGVPPVITGIIAFRKHEGSKACERKRARDERKLAKDNTKNNPDNGQTTD